MLLNIAYAIQKTILLNTIIPQYYSTTILKNLKCVHCLNIDPMEKARFMALMEYRPNGKDIMVSAFYFEVVMVMLKDKKILHKKCNVNKN